MNSSKRFHAALQKVAAEYTRQAATPEGVAQVSQLLEPLSETLRPLQELKPLPDEVVNAIASSGVLGTLVHLAQWSTTADEPSGRPVWLLYLVHQCLYLLTTAHLGKQDVKPRAAVQGCFKKLLAAGEVAAPRLIGMKHPQLRSCQHVMPWCQRLR